MDKYVPRKMEFPFDDQLGDFTLDELGDCTLDELSLPVEELLLSLKNRNANLPVETYLKLKKLCSDYEAISSKLDRNTFDGLKLCIEIILLILQLLSNMDAQPVQPSITNNYVQIIQNQTETFELLQKSVAEHK